MVKYSGKTTIDLDINGELRTVTVSPSDILLDTLRNQLGLTGAKPGCLNGDCGTCTVIIDNLPIKSCLTLTVETVGKKIITIEGLKDAPEQKAFVEKFAFQCGYCTSGFLMAIHALKINHPDAGEATVEEWLQSNICRCTGYSEIKLAALSVLNGDEKKTI